MPRSMQAAGDIAVQRLAADSDLAPLERVEAEQDAGQFGAAGAHQPGDAEHLAGLQA